MNLKRNWKKPKNLTILPGLRHLEDEMEEIEKELIAAFGSKAESRKGADPNERGPKDHI